MELKIYKQTYKLDQLAAKQEEVKNRQYKGNYIDEQTAI